MIRLFVALTVPEPVVRELSIMMAGLPGAKWAKPENLHLTLRFIGNTDGRTFLDIQDALLGVDSAAMDLRLQGVGQFGEGNRVDTLWAGVGASEPLKRLQAKIEQTIQRQGFTPEARKFHPHVTLARLKGRPDTRLHDWLQHYAAYRSLPFRIEEFHLFSSFLSHSGAIYQIEQTYPLH